MALLLRIKKAIAALAIISIHGCASSQLISPQSVEDKVGQIKLGVTTMSEVETILGTQHIGEDRRWFYNISDQAIEISERKIGMLSGLIPIAPATVATNTRALVTIGFTDNGKVTALEVARFFDPPFINDYRYRIKDGATNVLDFVLRAAEANDLRVAESDKSAGMLALEDSASAARVVVKLENQTLHITSKNPHDRVTTAYRVFAKRESAFIRKISSADFLW